MIKYFLLILSFLFTACNGTSSETTTKGVNLDFSHHQINIEKLTGSSELNITIGDEPKDIYFLFTNRGNHSEMLGLTSDKSLEDYQKTERVSSALDNEYPDLSRNSLAIDTFNHQQLQKEMKKETLLKTFEEKSFGSSDRKEFFLSLDRSESTWAVLKKDLQDIATKQGIISLKIWVSEENFSSSCITQEMVDALASSFLKEGEDNDIYDWVTNIFGEPWGETGMESFIDNKHEINILLTDIDHDNKIEDAVSGYFYAKDNYKQTVYSGSNEQLMFYLDAPIFAFHKEETDWSIDQYQPKRMLSTLAHELEHMIYFYQKSVLEGLTESLPWVDEMLAVSTEDILATKLKTLGIRGVPSFFGDAGEYKIYDNRLARFNKSMDESLFEWNGELKDYSKVAAFGAYLMRNYGGAEILYNIMHNPYGDEAAVVYGVNQSSLVGKYKDFYEILQDWGIAILLSSEEQEKSFYKYNRGDFFEFDYNETLYSLGSINFFNYYIQPLIKTQAESINPHANLYYKIGEGISGDLHINIEVPETVDFAIVSK